MARKKQCYTVSKLKSFCKISKRTNCWTWQRSRNTGGYGVCIHNQQHWLVHRLMCVLHCVENWEYLEYNIVLHHCDNPPCCNPEHLTIGTHGENIRDAKSKGRWNTFNRGTGGKRFKINKKRKCNKKRRIHKK